jgi:hypothetical protein
VVIEAWDPLCEKVVPIPLDVIKGPAFPLPERIWNRSLNDRHIWEDHNLVIRKVGHEEGAAHWGAGAGKMVRRGDVIQQ